MSALYYNAKRKTPLTKEELLVIDHILKKYLSNKEAISVAEKGGGELFSFSTNPEPPTVLNGSTKLPVDLFPDDIDDFIYVAEHWIDLISELKNTITNAEWSASLDDQPLSWNESKKKFDYPKTH